MLDLSNFFVHRAVSKRVIERTVRSVQVQGHHQYLLGAKLSAGAKGASRVRIKIEREEHVDTQLHYIFHVNFR